MLDGFTPWPPEWRNATAPPATGKDLTLWDMVARTVARLPDKVALVAGERRQTYADLDRAERPPGRRATAPGHPAAGPGGGATAQQARIRRTATWRWCASARFR